MPRSEPKLSLGQRIAALQHAQASHSGEKEVFGGLRLVLPGIGGPSSASERPTYLEAKAPILDPRHSSIEQEARSISSSSWARWSQVGSAVDENDENDNSTQMPKFSCDPLLRPTPTPAPTTPKINNFALNQQQQSVDRSRMSSGHGTAPPEASTSVNVVDVRSAGSSDSDSAFHLSTFMNGLLLEAKSSETVDSNKNEKRANRLAPHIAATESFLVYDDDMFQPPPKANQTAFYKQRSARGRLGIDERIDVFEPQIVSQQAFTRDLESIRLRRIASEDPEDDTTHASRDSPANQPHTRPLSPIPTTSVPLFGSMEPNEEPMELGEAVGTLRDSDALHSPRPYRRAISNPHEQRHEQRVSLDRQHPSRNEISDALQSPRPSSREATLGRSTSNLGHAPVTQQAQRGTKEGTVHPRKPQKYHQSHPEDAELARESVRKHNQLSNQRHLTSQPPDDIASTAFKVATVIPKRSNKVGSTGNVAQAPEQARQESSTANFGAAATFRRSDRPQDKALPIDKIGRLGESCDKAIKDAGITPSMKSGKGGVHMANEIDQPLPESDPIANDDRVQHSSKTFALEPSSRDNRRLQTKKILEAPPRHISPRKVRLVDTRLHQGGRDFRRQLSMSSDGDVNENLKSEAFAAFDDDDSIDFEDACPTKPTTVKVEAKEYVRDSKEKDDESSRTVQTRFIPLEAKMSRKAESYPVDATGHDPSCKIADGLGSTVFSEFDAKECAIQYPRPHRRAISSPHRQRYQQREKTTSRIEQPIDTDRQQRNEISEALQSPRPSREATLGLSTSNLWHSQANQQAQRGTKEGTIHPRKPQKYHQSHPKDAKLVRESVREHNQLSNQRHQKSQPPENIGAAATFRRSDRPQDETLPIEKNGRMEASCHKAIKDSGIKPSVKSEKGRVHMANEIDQLLSKLPIATGERLQHDSKTFALQPRSRDNRRTQTKRFLIPVDATRHDPSSKFADGLISPVFSEFDANECAIQNPFRGTRISVTADAPTSAQNVKEQLTVQPLSEKEEFARGQWTQRSARSTPGDKSSQPVNTQQYRTSSFVATDMPQHSVALGNIVDRREGTSISQRDRSPTATGHKGGEGPVVIQRQRNKADWSCSTLLGSAKSDHGNSSSRPKTTRDSTNVDKLDSSMVSKEVEELLQAGEFSKPSVGEAGKLSKSQECMVPQRDKPIQESETQEIDRLLASLDSMANGVMSTTEKPNALSQRGLAAQQDRHQIPRMPDPPFLPSLKACQRSTPAMEYTPKSSVFEGIEDEDDSKQSIHALRGSCVGLARLITSNPAQVVSICAHTPDTQSGMAESLEKRAYASVPIRNYWRDYSNVRSRGSFDSVSLSNSKNEGEPSWYRHDRKVQINENLRDSGTHETTAFKSTQEDAAPDQATDKPAARNETVLGIRCFVNRVNGGSQKLWPPSKDVKQDGGPDELTSFQGARNDVVSDQALRRSSAVDTGVDICRNRVNGGSQKLWQPSKDVKQDGGPDELTSFQGSRHDVASDQALHRSPAVDNGVDISRNRVDVRIQKLWSPSKHVKRDGGTHKLTGFQGERHDGVSDQALHQSSVVDTGLDVRSTANQVDGGRQMLWPPSKDVKRDRGSGEGSGFPCACAREDGASDRAWTKRTAVGSTVNRVKEQSQTLWRPNDDIKRDPYQAAPPPPPPPFIASTWQKQSQTTSESDEQTQLWQAGLSDSKNMQPVTSNLLPLRDGDYFNISDSYLVSKISGEGRADTGVAHSLTTNAQSPHINKVFDPPGTSSEDPPGARSEDPPETKSPDEVAPLSRIVRNQELVSKGEGAYFPEKTTGHSERSSIAQQEPEREKQGPRFPAQTNHRQYASTGVIAREDIVSPSREANSHNICEDGIPISSTFDSDNAITDEFVELFSTTSSDDRCAQESPVIKTSDSLDSMTAVKGPDMPILPPRLEEDSRAEYPGTMTKRGSFDSMSVVTEPNEVYGGYADDNAGRLDRLSGRPDRDWKIQSPSVYRRDLPSPLRDSLIHAMSPMLSGDTDDEDSESDASSQNGQTTTEDAEAANHQGCSYICAGVDFSRIQEQLGSFCRF